MTSYQSHQFILLTASFFQLFFVWKFALKLSGRRKSKSNELIWIRKWLWWLFVFVDAVLHKHFVPKHNHEGFTVKTKTKCHKYKAFNAEDCNLTSIIHAILIRIMHGMTMMIKILNLISTSKFSICNKHFNKFIHIAHAYI